MEGARSLSRRAMIKNAIKDYFSAKISMDEFIAYTQQKYEDGAKALEYLVLANFAAGTAAEQARYCVNHNVIISKAQLQPGDLRKNGCMYAGDHCGRYRNIHHVSIYIGNNKVIEASSSKGRVVIRKLWGEDGFKWKMLYFSRPYMIK